MRENLVYAPFYEAYIKNSAKYQSIVEGLQKNFKELKQLESSINLEKEDYAYQEGKWTIKELIQHLSDTERILSCRALRIGRGDKTKLTGFDHDEFVNQSNVQDKDLANIFDELYLVRQATMALFSGFNAQQFTNVGNANNSKVSLNALGYIIIGHTMHHVKVIKERYL